ncbi:MAG: DUF1566 domain-containing protein [Geobacteraceae bacterium]|nr:DUF1566 domain-containing protein [Geobacteraceae bacterium]
MKKLNSEQYLGYSDWRLPNRKELRSLVDISRYNPALPAGHPFTNVQASFYWSSSTFASSTDYAWVVNLRDGSVLNYYKYGYGNYYVWPVRAGQSGSFGSSGILNRFDITADGANPIGSQAVNIQFPVTITAKDAYGNVVTGFAGEVRLETYGGITPMFVQLSNGAWSGQVKMSSGAVSTRIIATGGGVMGASNQFSVTGAGATTGRARLKVMDNVGNALSGATVHLATLDNATDYPGTTGSSGTYTFTNIPAGQYYAWAESDSICSDRRTVHIAAGGWAEPRPIVLPLYRSTDVPVVLVPGIMGSTSLQGNSPFPEFFRTSYYDPNDLQLHDPARGAGWFNFSPGWRDLKEALKAKGLKDAGDIIDAPWDWRMPLDQAVEKYLKPAITKAKNGNPTGKVNIIAHSMGGLLVRAYIQGRSYEHDVLNFSMVGTPNKGSTNAYYFWEGGDPLKVDNITDNGFWVKNFYWETTEKMYEDTYKLGNLSTDYNLKIQKFFGDKIPTVRQLLPTYDFLRSGGSTDPITTSGNDNDLLKRLNHDDNRNDLMGTSYDNGRVKTRVYYSDSARTMEDLDVAATSGSLYADGRPIRDPSMSRIGDGTVPMLSAKLPCDEGWALCSNISGKHASLIHDNVSAIVNDLYSATATVAAAKAAVRTAAQAAAVSSLLSVSVQGNVLPYLVDPLGKTIGVNPASGDLENTIPGAASLLDGDAASLSLDNPADGTYALSFTGSEARDYILTIGYGSAGAIIEKVVRGFNPVGTTSFTFTVDAGSTERITINRTPQPPSGLQADAVGTTGPTTRLSWQATGEPGVTGYAVYGRQMDEPFLARIGTATGTTFDTGHPWASDNTIKTRYYAVTALTADGKESFLSTGANNDDRDHDGLTDAEEATLGSDPAKADSDGDGFNDLLEVLRGANPLIATSLPPLNLSVLKGGAGNGTVTFNPPGYSQPVPYAALYPANVQVTIIATPEITSYFSGWSGGCSGTTDCFLTMNGDVTVTATFASVQPVRIAGTTPAYFPTLQAAYTAAAPGSVIEALAVDFFESLTIDETLTLRGGFSNNYQTKGDHSSVLGLTVRGGALTVENLIIK